MAGAVFRCFFLGYSTTFRQNRRPFPGKPGGAAATNTAGKNGLLRGQNKAERNCRHAQGTQRIKSRSCRTKNEPPHFLSGIPYGLANGGGSRFRNILCQGRAVRPAHTPQADKKKTPPDKLEEFPFYAGGGGLPRTERQPAGLIARPAKQGRAVRPAHTPQIKKRTPPDKLGEFLFYAGGGGRTHTCY